MSDTDAIDDAVVTTLRNDSPLMALMTDGVWFEKAPAGKTKFVLVFQEDHQDEYSMNEHAYEVSLYVVMACDMTTDATVAKQAASRIQALLHGQSLTIVGYRHMHTLRRGRIRETKDDEDLNASWQHRGGRYEVMAAPNS